MLITSYKMFHVHSKCGTILKSVLNFSLAVYNIVDVSVVLSGVNYKNKNSDTEGDRVS